MSERAAFLRAIAEQPADRTARLVFADFLEETGSAPDAVRAAFVRSQVESETVHPNSNRAAELETRAEELFDAHWIDWWADACAVVGLPLPHRPSGVRGWLTRKLVGGVQRAGRPYKRRWPTTVGVSALDNKPPPFDTLKSVQFRGGFPESLSFDGTPGLAAEFLRKWADVSPLAALDLHGIVARDWRAIDGPHLNGVRTISLGQSNSLGLPAVAASPHLSQLEALHLIPDRSNLHWPAEQYRAFAGSPLAGRITRLSVVLRDVTEALAFHGAPLSNLTALAIRAPESLSEQEEFNRATDASLDLLSLPHLDHVEELTLDAITAHALRQVDSAVLGRLRKLNLTADARARYESLFNVWVLVPALTDLSLKITYGGNDWLKALTGSPFVGRLRHLRLDADLLPFIGHNQDNVLAMMELLRVLDADRVETLRLGAEACPSSAVRAAFREKFGDRVRFG